MSPETGERPELGPEAAASVAADDRLFCQTLRLGRTTLVGLDDTNRYLLIVHINECAHGHGPVPGVNAYDGDAAAQL
jgi:hypothetical protein